MSSISTCQTPRQRRLAPAVVRLLSFLGCAVTLQATPAAAQSRRPVPPSRDARHAAPPWSEATGTSVVSVARARATSSPPPPIDHPALHPDRKEGAPVSQRLFPRLAEVQEERRRKADAIARHPAGKAATRRVSIPGEAAAHHDRTGVPSHGAEAPAPARVNPGSPEEDVAHSHASRAVRPAGATYRVRSGDSLWRIAERTVGSSDPAAIDALTDRIYRLNRRVVGANPDLILPGQVLRLPRDTDR